MVAAAACGRRLLFLDLFWKTLRPSAPATAYPSSGEGGRMPVRLAATLWMAAAAVSGAEPSMPMVGERVRVETRSREWVTGAVLALDDGGLSISGQKAARRVAWSEVEWLD